MYEMNSIKSSIKSHPLWVALYPSDGLFYWGSELYLSNSRRGRRREEGGLLRLGTMELYLSNCRRGKEKGGGGGVVEGGMAHCG